MKNFITKNGIYHHKSGLFRIRERKGRNLEVCYTHRPGKWESTGTADIREAEANILSDLMNQGRSYDAMAITFGDFARNFFMRTDPDSFRVRQASFGKRRGESYYKAHQARLDTYIMPKFRDVPIKLISSLDIEKLYTQARNAKNGSELADNTKNKLRDCFSIIFTDAERKGVVDKNPCLLVTKITEHQESRKIFTAEELALLFPEDRTKLFEIWWNEKSGTTEGSPLMWATYFSIMADTGFRPGEVAALSKDCFIEHGVYTTRSVDGTTRTIKDSIKTSNRGQKYKVGLLSDYTLSLVAQLFQLTDDEYLFKINGRFLGLDTSNKHFKSACKRAGIELDGRVQYCLRHTFDTAMLNAIGDEMKQKEVQELMGHTTYRKEYDHRTATDRIRKLAKVKPIIDEIRNQA